MGKGQLMLSRTLAVGWRAIILLGFCTSYSLSWPHDIISNPSPSAEHQMATNSMLGTEHTIQGTLFSLMSIPGKNTIGVFIRSTVSINGFQFQLAHDGQTVPVKKCSGGMVDAAGYKCIVLHDEEHFGDSGANSDYTIVGISSALESTEIPAAPQRFRLLCELYLTPGGEDLETKQFELKNMMVISTKWTDLAPSFYSHFKPEVIVPSSMNPGRSNLQHLSRTSDSREDSKNWRSGLYVDFNFGAFGIEYLSIILKSEVPVDGFQFSLTDQNGKPLRVQNGFGGVCEEKGISMVEGPSSVIMGLSMGEDNEIGPGSLVLSNFKLTNESANLLSQEAHQGVVTYTACLADAVLSDAKGQPILSNDQKTEGAMQCFSVQKDSYTGEILSSSVPVGLTSTEDSSTAVDSPALPEIENVTFGASDSSEESSKNELILTLSAEPLATNEMHVTVSMTNLKPIQQLVFHFQDNQGNPIAVKDVSLAPPYLSNRVSPLHQDQLSISFDEGQVMLSGIESKTSIPAGSGPLLQATITGNWKSSISQEALLSQICIADVQGFGIYGAPLSIYHSLQSPFQSCTKVSSDLLSIIADNTGNNHLIGSTDISEAAEVLRPTPEIAFESPSSETNSDDFQPIQTWLNAGSISAICLGLGVAIIGACVISMRSNQQRNQHSSWSRDLIVDEAHPLLPHTVPTEIPVYGNFRRFHLISTGDV